MIRIEVGHGLDGVTAKASATSHGRMTVGPTRLLSWLETRFGQELPEVSFTARTLQYLACLTECDNDQRFYHRSLEQDDLGVAQELLQWRDQWYEAGWAGNAFSEAASRRLRDMAEIEQAAKSRVQPGTGQRVQRVTAALPGSLPGVSVVLLDPLETFAPAWQQLFEALGADARPWAAAIHGQPGSDLGRLQAALLKSADEADKVELSGDGSVLVLRDGSPHLSSHWVARYAQHYVASNGTVTAAILAETRGTVFDAARQEASMPRLGFGEPSSRRPVFQVLPLALELLWAPLDPTLLLQFLSHPIGPLPTRLRTRLAEVVADEPGIGGARWCRVMEESIEAAVEDREAAQIKKLRQKLSTSAAYWLESKRYAGEAGAPISAVGERIRRVSSWLAMSLSRIEDDAESSLFQIAQNQATELSTALARMEEAGASHISRDSLRRLVEAVRGSGSSRPDLQRECRAGEPQLLRADSPAAVLEPVPLVIWFGCDETRLPRPYPWSRVELAQLWDGGVGLLSLDTRLEWQASSWLRPIFAATDQLVLVLHDDSEGHHPVFDQILAVVEGWRELRVDEVIRSGEDTMAGHDLPTIELLEMHALPGPVRWWQLDSAEHLGPRDTESYTSLAKFMYGPYQWVLDYKAKLRAGTLAEIADGNRLKGTLVHLLFENFFGAFDDIASLDGAQAGAWVQAHLPQLIETGGAVLLESGRQAEKEDFVETTRRALVELIKHLQSANVVEVAMEVAHQGRFAGGELTGFIDLYATNADGQTALIDIKWGGYQYRRESLEESNYLQLATYAFLCHKKNKRWPELAYFIITEARLMVMDSNYFPNADSVVPSNEENVAEFWLRAEATWKWRRAQIDTGLIEVPVQETEPDEASSHDAEGLTLPDTYDKYSDFTALTGWGTVS